MLRHARVAVWAGGHDGRGGGCSCGGDGLPLVVAVRLLADGLAAVGGAAGVATGQAGRGAVGAVVGGVAGGVDGLGGGVGRGGFGEAGEAPFGFLVFGGVHGLEVRG